MPLPRQMEIHRNAPEERGKLDEIAAAAGKVGLTLPEAFTRLMGSSELQDRIPTCHKGRACPEPACRPPREVVAAACL